MASSNSRVILTKQNLKHLEPNLIESHIESYELFIREQVEEIFKEINPVEDYTGESWELHFGEISWGKPEVSFEEAQKLGLSYEKSLYVETKLVNKKTGEIKKQKIFITDIPEMSERATFVVSGNERVVVMQIARAEGILFTEAKSTSKNKQPNFAVKLMPERGRWFDFEMNKTGVMSVKLLDKKPKILLTTLLRALGYSSDGDIRRALKGAENTDDSFIEATLKKDPSTNTEEALIEIHRKLRPEDSV
ncbi:MAG: DNA-directed RNA polymerase subunit beta, partial [Candidatus Dojkabacteria bacterium]